MNDDCNFAFNVGPCVPPASDAVIATKARKNSSVPARLTRCPLERPQGRGQGGIPRNEVSRIEPLNLSAPKGQHDNSPGQASTASAALGGNALNIFSLSSRGGRRGPGRGGLPCGRFMGGRNY